MAEELDSMAVLEVWNPRLDAWMIVAADVIIYTITGTSNQCKLST